MAYGVVAHGSGLRLWLMVNGSWFEGLGGQSHHVWRRALFPEPSGPTKSRGSTISKGCRKLHFLGEGENAPIAPLCGNWRCPNAINRQFHGE